MQEPRSAPFPGRTKLRFVGVSGSPLCANVAYNYRSGTSIMRSQISTILSSPAKSGRGALSQPQVGRLDARVVEQFGAGSSEGDASVLEDEGAVGHRQGLIHVLLGEDDCEPPLAEAHDRIENELRHDRREAERWLIQQQEPGLRHEPPPQRQ